MELTVEKIEEFRRLRDAICSPYVAQDWEVQADYPNERRVILKRNKKLNAWLVFFGLCFYIIPGIIYIAYVKSTPEKKTLLY